MTYWLLVVGVVYALGVGWLLWTSVRHGRPADLGRVPLTLQRRTMLNDALRRQNTERGD